jgi:predicted RNA-binding Zn ribbon-like protein
MDDSQRSPLRIDNNLLTELGLAGLPAEEKAGFLKHIYETLEMRVGMRLADQMTNEQLDEFETFYNAKDDAGAFKWLETNFPNYKDIVADEFQNLKAEIAQSAPQILAASQQQAENAPATPQPQQMYPPQTPPASQSPEPPANAQY